MSAPTDMLSLNLDAPLQEGGLFLPNRQQVTFEKVEIAGRRSEWKTSESLNKRTPWELYPGLFYFSFTLQEKDE